MQKVILIMVATSLIAIALLYKYQRAVWFPYYLQIAGKRTVSEALSEYQLSAEARLVPHFKKNGVRYPPASITLLAIKDEKTVELWVNEGSTTKYIRSYPIQAASGVLGPKLREGDRQVPEGIYQLDYLNPNSAYHLSMKLNYPNTFDQKHARLEGRIEPGTNIFIHGKAVSIGCLAMGDSAIEELFLLVTEVGRKNVNIAIAPSDPRKGPMNRKRNHNAPWVDLLYTQIAEYFERFRHINADAK